MIENRSTGSSVRTRILQRLRINSRCNAILISRMGTKGGKGLVRGRGEGEEGGVGKERGKRKGRRKRGGSGVGERGKERKEGEGGEEVEKREGESMKEGFLNQLT